MMMSLFSSDSSFDKPTKLSTCRLSYSALQMSVLLGPLSFFCQRTGKRFNKALMMKKKKQKERSCCFLSLYRIFYLLPGAVGTLSRFVVVPSTVERHELFSGAFSVVHFVALLDVDLVHLDWATRFAGH